MVNGFLRDFVFSLIFFLIFVMCLYATEYIGIDNTTYKALAFVISIPISLLVFSFFYVSSISNYDEKSLSIFHLTWCLFLSIFGSFVMFLIISEGLIPFFLKPFNEITIQNTEAISKVSIYVFLIITSLISGLISKIFLTEDNEVEINEVEIKGNNKAISNHLVFNLSLLFLIIIVAEFLLFHVKDIYKDDAQSSVMLSIFILVWFRSYRLYDDVTRYLQTETSL